jgi:hypothetical protein
MLKIVRAYTGPEFYVAINMVRACAQTYDLIFSSLSYWYILILCTKMYEDRYSMYHQGLKLWKTHPKDMFQDIT